jgi:hypothetical protein
VILEREDSEGTGTGPTQKINLQNVANFSPPKNGRKITTLTTHFTTHLPSKNHVLHVLFLKTPFKNPLSHRFKKNPEKDHFHRSRIS